MEGCCPNFGLKKKKKANEIECNFLIVLSNANDKSKFSRYIMHLIQVILVDVIHRESTYTQPILVSLGAHTLSVATLVVHTVDSDGEGSTFGLL